MGHNNAAGFIYVLSNHSMPDIATIGRTERSPYLRLIELNQSRNTPEPFQLVAAWAVINSYDAEKRLHERLAEYRVHKDHEYFRYDVRSNASLLAWNCFHHLADPRGGNLLDPIFYAHTLTREEMDELDSE